MHLSSIGPSSPFLISDERILSFGVFHEEYLRLSALLKNEGVLSGQYVGITADHTWRYPVLLFALLEIGAVPCFINRYMTAEQIEGLREDVPFARVIGEKEMRVLCSIPLLCKEGEGEVDLAGFTPPHLPLQRGGMEEWNLQSKKTVFWTSGSSARPKAVLLNLANHVANALGANENIPLIKGNRWLASLPFFHVGGFAPIIRTLLSGASLVIPSDRSRCTEDVERNTITHCSMVTTQLKRYLDQEGGTAALKCLLLGGSAFPDALIDRAQKAKLPIALSYGLTEMASQVATTRTGGGKCCLLPNRELTIIDAEICVRGPCLFEGYLLRGDLVRPFDSEGWFRTGDLGSYEGADLKSLGRCDRTFQCGGENIQPEYIEQAISSIPGVRQALVLPMSDREYGMRPVAYVDMPMSADELRVQLKEKLAGFFLPKEIKPWCELPDGWESMKAGGR